MTNDGLSASCFLLIRFSCALIGCRHTSFVLFYYDLWTLALAFADRVSWTTALVIMGELLRRRETVSYEWFWPRTNVDEVMHISSSLHCSPCCALSLSFHLPASCLSLSSSRRDRPQEPRLPLAAMPLAHDTEEKPHAYHPAACRAEVHSGACQCNQPNATLKASRATGSVRA